MKKLFFQFLGLALFTGIILLAGCTADSTTGGSGGTPIEPLASLVAEAGFISANTEVDAGATFQVKLRLQAGSSNLKSLKIQEEGSNLSTDRFSVNSGAITSNNPLLITGTSKTGVTYEIAIKADTNYDVTKRYTFEVTDENGLSASVFVDITTKGVQVTTLTGVLLNQSGPAGQGGLDLDTGEGVGSVKSNTGNPAIDTSYKRAEINDEGIDLNKPSASNWLQQISGTNGAEVRYIGGAMPENFSFDNVNYQEEIIVAFNSGRLFTAKDSTGELISDPLKVGDILTVKRTDGKYYIIKVTKINVTTTDNKDSYEFSIKY